MPRLCRLADPEHYEPFDWDLRADPADFAYWLGLFETFPANIERRLREDGLGGEDFDARWRAFREEYAAGIEARRRDPSAYAPLTTITLAEFRQSMIEAYGWPDPYAGVKRRENELAAAMYPAHVARIDGAPPDERWALLLKSLMAGNMFDLGAPETIEMYNRGEVRFAELLERVPDRPWFIDHTDRLLRRVRSGEPYRQVLFFVDNAGADIVLGVIPLARELGRLGTRVVLAVNAVPALNDITIAELTPLLDRLAGGDAVLAELLERDRLAAIDSGNGTPLIDLSRVSDACDAAAAGSDLMVLQGMGRGMESNWRQTFTCDVWRVALIKDACVAKWLGAPLFEAVSRFDPSSTSPA